MYTHTCACFHNYTYVHTHIHKYVYIHNYVHTSIHRSIHPSLHAYINSTYIHTRVPLLKKGSMHYSFDGAGRLQLKLTEAHCRSPCLRSNTVWRFVSKVQWWMSHWGVTEVEIFKIHSSSQRSIAGLRSLLDLAFFKDLRPDSFVVGVLLDLLCELHTSKATLWSPSWSSPTSDSTPQCVLAR